MSNDKLGVVLIRGTVGAKHKVKHTLKLLNLHKKHHCVIIDDTDVNRGMLRIVKDYVTYGEITEDTAKKLEDERGEDKAAYRLSPPRGGFERKGIKVNYSRGGALGNRGEDINDLITRMI